MDRVTRFCGAVGAGLLALAAATALSEDVWTPGPLAVVYEGLDYSGKDDPKCEIRIAGTRGGAFSGQVVVFSKTPVSGSEAKIGELRHKDGRNSIPASAVEIRYALATAGNGNAKMPAGAMGAFDALDTKPRETGRTHPVWITVNVPADAAPGEYEGELTVAGREVPVKLSAADWVLPKPQDFTTWVDFIESPESVALRYGKKLWSEEHWKLVGATFDQLARVGNKTLYIPLMCQTHFGNSESMVRWIRQEGAGGRVQGSGDGQKKEAKEDAANAADTRNLPARRSPEGEGGKPETFSHDFSIAERYLDTCIRHAGRPRVVVLYIYEPLLGGSHGAKMEECQRGVPFSLLDPKSGEVTTAAGPCHNNGNPAYPNYPQDTIDFWKPVIDGMRERLNARGIGDQSIMVGISPDLSPGRPTSDYLFKAFPWARWCRQAHQPSAAHGAMPVGYMTSVYGLVPADKSTRIHALFFRDDWKLDAQMQLVAARTDFDVALSSGKPGTGKMQGVGRMSGDFWPCRKNDKGVWAWRLINRYPLSSWAQLSLYNQPFTYPGPDGALGTARLEMLREGVQECEARVFIEKALADKDSRAKLGDGLAGKAQGILTERLAALPNNQPGAPATKGDAGFVAGPWQERSGQLYAVAAEVASSLGKQNKGGI